jgi:hypothetical protein
MGRDGLGRGRDGLRRGKWKGRLKRGWRLERKKVI